MLLLVPAHQQALYRFYTGSSHGDGRIFRLAYQEDDYVAIAKAALIGWRELERDVQEELLLKTGGITAASR